jgi:ribosomal protein S18 acetylase RimI-like enzyme
VSTLARGKDVTTALTARKATQVDLPAILGLLADDRLGKTREAVGSSLHKDYLSAFQQIEHDNNQLLVVFEIENSIIGCLQISFIPGLSRQGMLRGQIEGVRVSRNHRGAGYGQQMLQWAIDTCRSRGCGLVQLTSDKTRLDALRFYDALGFERSHEGLKLHL